MAAQVAMKQQYDKHHIQRKFQVGNLVYLKMHKYKKQTVSQASRSKLAARYCGPFRILECIGEVTYRLELPPSSLVHPLFHVLRLKKYIGPNS